jgi:hypothetical protein
MSQTSDHYYARLTAGIDPNDMQQWEQQIAAAERRRIHDKTMMDIIGSVTIPNARCPEPDSAPIDGQTTSLEWLQLALEIEEKQYGIIFLLPS